ncbi:hypothetical protein CD33_06680 [Ureibacillus sinduriensis BLB-1 = JCM 15800]|uniref:GyrI-like small molecule binding domain-containing protein n=1 Tax=Ureibacillus sinduriensis BLB-1 = JCM 15800 TaxID=1384057 RepID=A0A0A3HUW1_9BACL|nr:hypothetical protein CD33_06680 [Ureibacillus sinduriensis BLB-1 = JCM 15800]
MDFQIGRKKFKVVGLKGRGYFENHGVEVPALAQQLLSRTHEIGNHLGIEIALYEPKRDVGHRQGHYIVGLIVRDFLKTVPAGMEFIDIDQQYATARGKISTIGSIHTNLINWANVQGYTRNLESYIVETYHPMDDGEEEVQIYLPVY